MQNLLDRLGWSQAHFARLMGVNKDTVHDWCKEDYEGTGAGYKAGMKYLELVVRLIASDIPREES